MILVILKLRCNIAKHGTTSFPFYTVRQFLLKKGNFPSAPIMCPFVRWPTLKGTGLLDL